MQHVLADYGNFLSLEEFKSKFNININYLRYLQLIATIPSYLKKRAAQTAVPQYVFSSTLASLPDGNSIDLSEIRCKKYYQLLNECGSIVPSGARKWEERYPEYFADWREKFRAIDKLTRDNKLRQFCFRLMTNALFVPTPIQLNTPLLTVLSLFSSIHKLSCGLTNVMALLLFFHLNRSRFISYLPFSLCFQNP